MVTPLSFQPDILVTTSDGIGVVVDAAVYVSDWERMEAELKRYMLGMRCPVGLIVTPERVRIYRDTYSGQSADSVELVGDFSTRAIWTFIPPKEPSLFESFVQDWLEGLSPDAVRALPQELAGVLRDLVVPAVSKGEVRAAHPRYA